jgi:hypothetical protein
MDGLQTVAAGGLYRPALCLRVVNIWKPCRMSYFRRRHVNHDVSKFAGSGGIFYVDRRRKKVLCSPTVVENSMFYTGGSSCVLRRWYKILCSTLAEVPMFFVGGRRFYVLRWQKFLTSPSVAKVSMLFYAGQSSYVLR